MQTQNVAIRAPFRSCRSPGADVASAGPADNLYDDSRDALPLRARLFDDLTRLTVQVIRSQDRRCRQSVFPAPVERSVAERVQVGLP